MSQKIPKANIFILGNKIDLPSERKISSTQCEAMSKKTNYKVYEISAKTGENLKRVFYTAVTTLPAFDGFHGSPEDIINLLEIENKDSNNNTNNLLLNQSQTDGINLETGKMKITDQNSSANRGELSFKVGPSTIHLGDSQDDFPKKKKCNC